MERLRELRLTARLPADLQQKVARASLPALTALALCVRHVRYGVAQHQHWDGALLLALALSAEVSRYACIPSLVCPAMPAMSQCPDKSGLRRVTVLTSFFTKYDETSKSSREF